MHNCGIVASDGNDDSDEGTNMQRTDCRPGQRVEIDCQADPRFHGKRGTISKVNSVNLRIDIDGMPRPLVINPTFVKPLTTVKGDDIDAVLAGAPSGSVMTSFEVDLEPLPPSIGEVVRCPKDPRINGMYVVIGDSYSRGQLLVKIAKLGGDRNKYWRVPPSWLEVMDLPTVKELLPA